MIPLKFYLTVFRSTSTSTFCLESFCKFFDINIVFIYTFDNSHEFSESSPYCKYFNSLNFTCNFFTHTKFFRKPTDITDF